MDFLNLFLILHLQGVWLSKCGYLLYLLFVFWSNNDFFVFFTHLESGDYDSYESCVVRAHARRRLVEAGRVELGCVS